jgi:hypothetical protein
VFGDAFPGIKMPDRDNVKFEERREAIKQSRGAVASLAPRGVGPTRWAADGSKNDVLARRRFVLIGQTLDGQRVWDVRRAVAAMLAREEFKDSALELEGKGEMAGIVLYAAIFEPAVKSLNLIHPSLSAAAAPPTLLNASRTFGFAEVLALAMPRRILISMVAPDELDKALHLAKTVMASDEKMRQERD